MNKEFWVGLSLAVIGFAGAGILLVLQIGNIITQNNAIAWLILFIVMLLAGLVTLIMGMTIHKPNIRMAKTIKTVTEENRTALPPIDDVVRAKTDRVMVNATPAYLTGLYKGYTKIQADKLAESFVGKWMKLSGPLNDVTNSSGDYVVYLENHLFPSGSAVAMRFDKSWKDRLSVLKVGDTIGVLGQIKDIDRVIVFLEKCELLD
jgi:hypothetical protein